MGKRKVPQPLRTTRTVRVLDLVQGDPPSLLLVERLRVRGRSKRFTQQVRVPDEGLFQRLLAEVEKGDEIEATVVTEFDEEGYTTRLMDFSKKEAAQ